MSNPEYFTDREYGVRPSTLDVIDERLWAGLYSLIQTRIGDGSFGQRFPEPCPYGCDEQAFGRVLGAEVPWIEWPISPREVSVHTDVRIHTHDPERN